MSLEAKLETNIQGTYDEDILSKFLEKHKDKLNQRGNYSIFLFIDKETFELDIKEWRSFNYFWEKFQAIGFNIIGVSTIGDDELGKVLMESNLLNIKFPVIVDTGILLSQTFGCYFTRKMNAYKDIFDMPYYHKKAALVFDDKMNLFYMEMRHDCCVSQPSKFISQVKALRNLWKMENV